MKKKKEWLPALLGVLAIALIVGAVLFLSRCSKEAAAARNEAEDDGELIDYEAEGTIKLGDYSNPKSLIAAEDLTEKNTDDPLGLLWDTYLETCEINSYPKNLLAEATKDAEFQLESFAEASEMSVEEVAESYGMDDSTISDNAKDDVTSRMVAKTIALRENLTLTDDDLKAKLIEIMEYDDKNATLETVMKDYVATESVRPRDDAYVLLVKNYLMEKHN